jgi:hypothetical protein
VSQASRGLASAVETDLTEPLQDDVFEFESQDGNFKTDEF